MNNIVLFLLLFQQAPDQDSLLKSYITAEYSISYPESWFLDESRKTSPAILFLSPLTDTADQFSENVNILKQNLKGREIDLSQYKQISEAQFRKYAVNGNMLNSRIEKKGDTERYYMEYLMTLNSNDLHIISICYIKNDMAYLITFTANTKTFKFYQQTGLSMLESFKLAS